MGKDEATIRSKHRLPDNLALTQDDDVLDTWFSSALWTFSTLGWPEKTEELAKFHPASVLVTGFDIIFFWVARMIMMSLHLKREVPFKQVYVHGLVRDGEGQKMSKSKGNVLDPIDLIDGIDLETLVNNRTSSMMQPQQAAKIEKATRKQFPDGIPGYGTDALRYTFYSLASTGRDIKFDLGRMEGFRNFCNKLWNAARYVLMNTQGFDPAASSQRSDADEWILSRLQTTMTETANSLEQYRFARAAQTLNGNSIAYELLRRANLMLSEEWEPAQAALESDPEDLDAQVAFSRAEKRLGRYHNFILDLMTMRDLMDYYDD